MQNDLKKVYIFKGEGEQQLGINTRIFGLKQSLVEWRLRNDIKIIDFEEKFEQTFNMPAVSLEKLFSAYDENNLEEMNILQNICIECEKVFGFANSPYYPQYENYSFDEVK